MLFIEPLNRFKIGNLPLGFWFAQQGSIYVFILLTLIYAIAMDRLDRRYGLSERRSQRDETAPTGASKPGEAQQQERSS